MKTLSLTLLLVCLIVAVAHPYDHTLITDQTAIGGFAAPAVRFVDLKGEFGILAGGRIGAVINHAWSIGFGAYGTVNGPTPDDFEGLDRLEMAYGGLTLEYVFKPHAVFHVALPVFIGGGQVRFEGGYLDPETGDDSDTFFVLEPEFDLEFNITRSLRVDLGVGYRHISGTELADISDEDLSGVNGVITFKMGAF